MRVLNIIERLLPVAVEVQLLKKACADNEITDVFSFSHRQIK